MQVRIHGQPPALMPSFDGIESSLLLADDFWESFEGSVPGSIVIGMPARDVLIITGSRSPAGIAKARRAVDRMFFAGGRHLLTPTVRIVATVRGMVLVFPVQLFGKEASSQVPSSAKTACRTGS